MYAYSLQHLNPQLLTALDVVGVMSGRVQATAAAELHSTARHCTSSAWQSHWGVCLVRHLASASPHTTSQPSTLMWPLPLLYCQPVTHVCTWLTPAAVQVTDEGFRLLCQRPLTALRHLHLGGLPAITDAAFLHLTASCRGLTAITLKSCPGLTDKTLARIAGCQQVTSVTLKRGGRGVTEQGVVALVNGLRVTRVEVSGCPMVHLGRRPPGRAAVHLTVDGKVL